MNPIYHIALAATMASSAPQQADTLATTPAQAVMSLDRCIEIALSQNPTVIVADMEIERTDYSRKETLAQLFPVVNFGATYTRMLAKQTMYMNFDMGAMGGGAAAGGDGDTADEAASRASSSKKDDGIKMGLDNSWSVGFNASMPLIAPQLWQSLKLSDSQILQSVETARSSRLSLVNQVKSAWYTLLLTIDSRRTIAENLDMARLTAEIYEKQYALGTASQYDVLRTSVAVKNIEPELAQAEVAIRQARLQLAVLMGIDPADVEITPDKGLSDYQDAMYHQALLAEAHRDISGNSELRQLDISTSMLERSLAIQKAAFLPTLALSANYNWTSSSDGSPFKNFRWNPYSMIGLTLSIPLIDVHNVYATKQAKIQVDEMKWRRADLTRAINMQVDLAIDNINTNVRQIESCSESVRQADTAYGIARQSFDIGAASYLDLRDAELALTRSRLSYYQAIYNYLVATGDLELMLGTFDLTPYTPAR
ncbi:MAG: TolC family protein [Bacteroides sp.]|nr:TolC family protein [Bacteroides sp.]